MPVPRLHLLLVSVILVLGVVPSASATTPDARQTATPDALWYLSGTNAANFGVCASPTSAASIAGCFATPPSGGSTGGFLAADDTNVYYAIGDGSQSCPISGLGANCTPIEAGPFGSATLTAFAAAGGSLYIGQSNGKIYRCPANLPPSTSSDVPAQCVLLDDAGSRDPNTMLAAGGRLYVGLGPGGTFKPQMYLWSCDLVAANSCLTLDAPGSEIYSISAGGGYLWVGLHEGVLWRCNPSVVNACAVWDTASGPIASVAYDGQGTIYTGISNSSKTASSQNQDGLVWSCPAATANACSTLLTPGVYAFSEYASQTVAAGAGYVFANPSYTSVQPGIYFGTTPYALSLPKSYPPPVLSWTDTSLLYTPVGGPVTLGRARVEVRIGGREARLGGLCADEGRVEARIRVAGPHRMRHARSIDLCAQSSVRLGLLDSGRYRVTARARTSAATPWQSAQATFQISGGATRRVTLNLLQPRD